MSMSDTTASTAAAETTVTSTELFHIRETAHAALVRMSGGLHTQLFCEQAKAIDAAFEPILDRIRNVPSPASPEPEARGETKLWREGQKFQTSKGDGWQRKYYVEGGVVYYDGVNYWHERSSTYGTLASFEAAIASRELVPVDPAPTVEKAADHGRIVAAKREYRLRVSRGDERNYYGIWAVSGERAAYWMELDGVVASGPPVDDILDDELYSDSDRAIPADLGERLDAFWTAQGWDSPPAPRQTFAERLRAIETQLDGIKSDIKELIESEQQ